VTTVERAVGNKGVALALLEAQDAGDMAALAALLAPDVTWWFLSRGDFDRATFLAIAARRYPAGAGRRSSVIGLAAEQDRVAVEYETEQDGAYRVVHLLLQLRDELVVSGREYLDPPPVAVLTGSQAVPAGLAPFAPVEVTAERTDETREMAKRFLGPGPDRLSMELVAADIRWWVGGVGYRDFIEYFSNMAERMSHLEPPVAFDQKVLGMTVEGDRAAVQIVTDVTWPEHDYRNQYLCVVVVRDGKVVEFREHTDRHSAARAGIHAPE
jgi:ketosteroid isomerase-like protein